MAKQSLDKVANRKAVDAFLDKVDNLPARHGYGDRPGRLIFAMDATASRARTWDMASKLQADMFRNTKAIGELQLQLVFFRGHRECKSSRWLDNSDQLLRLMSSVSCLADKLK